MKPRMLARVGCLVWRSVFYLLLAGGAASAYAEEVVIFFDDFETDQGWVVGDAGDNATAGIWERADPQGTLAQPEDDHTADPGVKCWVTDARRGLDDGAYDVDGGKTTLKSPTINLAGYPDATVSYWRWYHNSAGYYPNNDTFAIDLSNDNGLTWVRVETIGPAGEGTAGGWLYHEFQVASFMAPTAQMKIRFIAQDLGNPSLVEAAVDDFRVTVGDGSPCPGAADGDLDGSGVANGADIQRFVTALLGMPGPVDLCHGDFNDDARLDAEDVPPFVAALLAQ